MPLALPSQIDQIEDKLPFTSESGSELLKDLKEFFGPGVLPFCYKTDLYGFHVVWNREGGRVLLLKDLGDAFRRAPGQPTSLELHEKVVRWSDSLDYHQKRRICGTRPSRAAHVRGTRQQLTGFTVKLFTPRRPISQGVTEIVITPAWV